MRYSRVVAIGFLLGAANTTPIEDLPPTKVQKRDVFEAASSAASNVFNSILSEFPSATAAVVGVLSGLDVTPNVDDAKSQFNLTDEKIEQLPIQVLNLPGYANYTGDRWNLLVHGLVYKTPLTSGPALEEAADGFVPDVEVKDLPPQQKANALNLTAALYSIPVEDEGLNFDLSVNGSNVASFDFPVLTDSRGEFNKWIQLEPGLIPYQSDKVQKFDVHVNASQSGNATAYLVPDEGVTVISDVDDILRVTKIWIPEEGLNNTFVNNFVSWMNMPEIYKEWSKSIAGVHFHYLTTVPEPGTRIYEQYIYSNYPAGSFDTRPSNFTTIEQIFAIRDFLLRRIIETYPKRKFVLVGDVSNRDIMKDYPALAEEYSGRICVLLRNVTATDDSMPFPYDTSAFEKLPNNTYMFFNVPDDLRGLDFNNLQCRNNSIAHNSDFGYQNLPFGAGYATAASFANILLGFSIFLLGIWIL